MPTFDYTAVEPRSGRESGGSIDASSSGQATKELRARGLAPTSVTSAVAQRRGPFLVSATNPQRMNSYVTGRPPPRGWLAFAPAINRKRLTQFTRQLATLTKAGVPLVRALEIVARPAKNHAFKEMIAGLADGIRSGHDLSSGLEQHPRVFDPLYVSMVKAGEAGGVMDSVLDRLARFMERMERVKGRVKAAMMYPCVILLVAVGILAGLMVFVVPKFEQVFSGLLKGQPLPQLTRLVLSVGNFAQHHSLLAFGLGSIAAVGFKAFHRSPSGRRVSDWCLIRLPILGSLLLNASVARFTRTLGSLLASGVPILDALVITRDTSGNIHVAKAISSVHDRVKGGDAIARSLEAVGLFPSFVTSMIEVGEETGDLAGMLIRIADGYDDEVDNAVAALTSIVEPVMIVIMAVMVGTIVIALFLPIVSIIQHLQ